MTDPNDLTKWLKEESKNKSFRQLEKELGLNHSTIHRIVNGKITDNRQSTLRKIEAAMKSRGEDNPAETDESYISIVANSKNMTVGIKTNIDDFAEVVSFAVFAASLMALDGEIPESVLNTMVSNTYRAMQEKKAKSFRMTDTQSKS